MFFPSPGDKTTRRVAEAMLAPDRLARLLLELAVLVDIGAQLAHACYCLEADKNLALYVHQHWETAKQHLRYTSAY